MLRPAQGQARGTRGRFPKSRGYIIRQRSILNRRQANDTVEVFRVTKQPPDDCARQREFALKAILLGPSRLVSRH